MFEVFIPRSWRFLLETMASQKLIGNIFHLWPPAQPAGEINAYCSTLAQQLFDELAEANSTVWPVYPDSVVVYDDLSQLVVTNPFTSGNVLAALKTMGVRSTCVQTYIHDLALRSPKEVAVLSPESAHQQLQVSLLQMSSLTCLLS